MQSRIPEDFAAYQLTKDLSEFARSRPGLRLDVRGRLSVEIQRALERGELDLALYKRDPRGRDAIAAWPEQLRWVASQRRLLGQDVGNDGFESTKTARKLPHLRP